MSQCLAPSTEKLPAWPRQWPSRGDCPGDLARKLDALATRLPHGFKAPLWWRYARLAHLKSWRWLTLPVEGEHAARFPNGAKVTAWQWELMQGPLPGLRLLAKRRPDDSVFLLPIHTALTRRMAEGGLQTATGISAASMLVAVAGFDSPQGRARLANRDPADLRVFNLRLEGNPVAPDGFDARRARLGFRLTREFLTEHYNGGAASQLKTRTPSP